MGMRQVSRLAVMSLVACTVLVATVTFVLSFVGLSDYASRVAGVSGRLSWLVPVGVDGLTLCGVAATYALRHSRWRTRMYAWLVFGVAVAASIAGNVSHAAARQLSGQGMIGAAAWPALLALASHLVIVTTRHVDQTRQPSPAAQRAVSSARVSPPPDMLVSAPRAREVTAVQILPRADTRTRVRQLASEGMTQTAIADQLGVSIRTVQRHWAKEMPS